MVVAAAWIIAAVVSNPSALAVEVAGTASCPSPADVAAALPGLIAARDPDAAADVATLTADGDSVTVALSRASGEAVGEKQLDAGLSCEQRARAAAVVIAAWEARLASQAATLVVPPEPPAAVVAPNSPIWPIPSTGPAREDDVVELGVSAGGSINGTTLAPAAAIEVAYARPLAYVVPAVAALFVGSHEMSIGPGTASWRRYGLVATAASRRNRPPLWAEARLGVALTLLDISGNSFPINHSGVTFDPGVEVGARSGLRYRRMRWWLDGTVAFWPRGQDVTVQGAPGSTTLPRAQALLSLGAAYEIIP
jgi:hypothetical protein